MKKKINNEEVVEFYRGRHITIDGCDRYSYYLNGKVVDEQYVNLDDVKLMIDHDTLF